MRDEAPYPLVCPRGEVCSRDTDDTLIRTTLEEVVEEDKESPRQPSRLSIRYEL